MNRMPEDFIDAEEQETETEPKEDMEEEGKDEGEDSGQESALLPKSILGGENVKPGQQLTMKVVHVYEDEVEVQFSKAGSSGAEEGIPEMKSAEASLEGMASAGGGY